MFRIASPLSCQANPVETALTYRRCRLLGFWGFGLFVDTIELLVGISSQVEFICELLVSAQKGSNKLHENQGITS